MIPKQREMDDIIRSIFTALESESHLQDTLFVVGGDHGMNAKGNHGGSSVGETSAALMFISPKLKGLGRGRPCPAVPHTGDFDFYTRVDQSDIVPTLSGLLGFAIPKNSLGVFIQDLLPLLGDTLRHIQFLQANAAQLLNILHLNEPIGSCNATTYVSSPDCLWNDYQTTDSPISQRADGTVERFYQVILSPKCLKVWWSS